MDIYRATETFLREIPVVQSWPEIETCIQRVTAKKLPDWQLPLRACLAVGGTADQATPAVAAIACAQMSIILVDDMLDDDPRGEYQRIGMPSAANMAVALAAIGTEALTRNKQEMVRITAVNALNEMLSQTAWGQYLDVQNPSDEAAYWHLVRSKSSPFFRAALYVGALLGGASMFTAEQLAEFGGLYGEMIQIHDDLNDTLETPANPDWLQGRFPLPILFAHLVDHPDREQFIALRRHIANPKALAEAQRILIRSGAVSYSIDQFLQRYHAAQELLSQINLVNKDPVATLLEPLINPVKALYAEVGLTNFDEAVDH
ncbi:MAG: hypothetical protein CL608_04620 [Anaerolineaceae bacterium]|nr:hypothetical protein [Anaerolineaceae bacterium]